MWCLSSTRLPRNPTWDFGVPHLIRSWQKQCMCSPTAGYTAAATNKDMAATVIWKLICQNICKPIQMFTGEEVIWTCGCQQMGSHWGSLPRRNRRVWFRVWLLYWLSSLPSLHAELLHQWWKAWVCWPRALPCVLLGTRETRQHQLGLLKGEFLLT